MGIQEDVRAIEKANFQAWMTKVDSWCYKLVGVSYLDLADCNYWDMFSDGCGPKEAAKEALQNEGWLGGM